MAFIKKHTMRFLLMMLLALGGVIGAVVIQPRAAYAAAQMPAQIGIVDYMYLIDHHPDTAQANDALKTERDAAQKEYNEKSTVLNDQGKQALQNELNQKVEQKRLELLKPITEKINAAINEVAQSKKLTAVAYKNTFAYGGVDITQEVADKLDEK